MDSQRQLSNLVSNRLPEFVRVDNPTMVAFLEAYYEWLQESDRGGKLLSPMALGDVIDVDNTLDDFVAQFKREYLFNFPEQLAISKTTGRPVDERKLVKNIKAFYRAKGTEKAYEFLFRILYDVDVEFYYPKKDILRVSDGKWFEKNSLKVTNRLGEDIFESVGRVIYQRNTAGQISASAKVTDVSVYQEGVYEVAELNIVGKNGTFQAGSPFSFDTDTESFNELKVYSVVSSVTVNTAGTGYSVGDLVTFTSAAGDSGINARGTVSLVSSTGGIRRIRMDSFGINYTSVPTVSIQSLGGSGFVGTAVLGSLCQSDGYYLNFDGRLSTDKVLQDNHYYQEYSYALKTEVVIDKYRETLRRLVHPAGTAMFGQVLLKRCAYEDLNNTSALIRYEVPIIGHYAPYTFQTYDDLQEWFKDGLTASGYSPDYHNPYIQQCSIPGNPVSSGVINLVPEGLTGMLGTVGFKNSDPFWFIYQHPNRRIYEPTIARIWRNQVMDNAKFDWIWDEHCSVTGGLPPSGWTADFYEAIPVDNKYAFLKYDSTSEFRKITARAFFEIPIGFPFDCRGIDYEQVASSQIVPSYPKDGQTIVGDFTMGLTVQISYLRFELNGDPQLPNERRVVKVRVLVNGQEYQVLDLGTPPRPITSLLVNKNRLNTNGSTPNIIRVEPLNSLGQVAKGLSPTQVNFVLSQVSTSSTTIGLQPQ